MAQEDVAPIRVGLLGAGTVGSQTARLLVEQKDELAARIGRPIELTGVACLDPVETDPFPWIDKAIVTTDTMSVATNSDIVIELIGGTGVARKFVLAAIESGAEEQAILLHEEGHFATGAFYTVQSPYTIRQKQENIANRYIYKRYFPPQRLQAAMAAGLREPWQLAEYFDLPEAMIREMLDYYQAQGLLELCPEEEL